MQAALGLSQLAKLEAFVEARRANFKRLFEGIKTLDNIHLPRATQGSDPSWFGFPITIKSGSNVTRESVIQNLTSQKIGTRLLFGGNLLRQPAYAKIERRIASPLGITEQVMSNTFWVGVHPGLTDEMIDFMALQLTEAFNE